MIAFLIDLQTKIEKRTLSRHFIFLDERSFLRIICGIFKFR